MVTSTKADVAAITAPRRSGLGQVWVWDPTGSTVLPAWVEPLRWSPLVGCADWAVALQRSWALVAAARPNPGGDAVFWTERAQALLASLFHAGAISGRPLVEVMAWLARRDPFEPSQLLAEAGPAAAPAGDLLAGITSADPRETSGTYSTADAVLGAYRNPATLAATTEPNFDPTPSPEVTTRSTWWHRLPPIISTPRSSAPCWITSATPWPCATPGRRRCCGRWTRPPTSPRFPTFLRSSRTGEARDC
ncbi:MAG: type IV secretory system conjugative DNA transfer family protein [Acidimicrobiales bacterium]